ncbi:uncharacterized protein LOC114865050 isoform X2 [Betta splendens]|uniref:Uncharacterized protein LOC114865050 isoform X2 n=1 Tax=Betta splendens TaxID=158456 RepID=A0A6P7NPT5_BETSP|nr:uncharacterized protein LOC114865050 isoform X2 [Betta splendens]
MVRTVWPITATQHHAEMILLSMFLLLHTGYALISVIIVELGEPVTFTCSFPDAQYSNTRVKWYKQSTGDSLKLITTLMKATLNPAFEEEFRFKRFSVNHTEVTSTLTINDTVQADEAVYHCAVITWSKDRWSGTYLGFKGNSEKTSNYSVVQTSSVSDPVRPGDSVTLQCSVLSASDNKTCPGGPSVYWFRAGSDQSPPGIISTDGNNDCEQRSDSVKSCVYRFSKTISSSDAGTYRCAVATCGQMLFGTGTTLKIQETSLSSTTLGVVVLAVTVVASVFLLFAVKENKCECWTDSASLQEDVVQRNFKFPQRHQDTGVYSAVVFTVVKSDRGGARGTKAA